MAFESNARREVAARAATLIADSALDYREAKRRAAEDLYGDDVPRAAWPDNEEVDAALREHLDLFERDAHRARVAAMRRAALELMAELEDYAPHVTGAAWKGIAAAHAMLHLQLFSDSGKEVAIHLLNMGLDPEPTEAPHFRGEGTVEALVLEWRGVPVLLSLYEPHERRGASKAGRGGEPERGSRAQLQARMRAEEAGDAA